MISLIFEIFHPGFRIIIQMHTLWITSYHLTDICFIFRCTFHKFIYIPGLLMLSTVLFLPDRVSKYCICDFLILFFREVITPKILFPVIAHQHISHIKNNILDHTVFILSRLLISPDPVRHPENIRYDRYQNCCRKSPPEQSLGVFTASPGKCHWKAEYKK